MNLFGDPTVWLPVAFATLMGLSILAYVILDGYDLGVGMLFPLASDDEKDLATEVPQRSLTTRIPPKAGPPVRCPR